MKNFLNIKLFLILLFLSWQIQANPVACFKTTEGDFCIELFEFQTPITVSNFLGYSENESYVGSIFHRSEPGFILQSGGFEVIDNGNGGASLVSLATRDPIQNEFGISNMRSTVAMAKLDGDPNSATNQWFVNLADNSSNLDNQNGGFTVFGQIIYDGMATIDTITSLPIVNFGGALANTPTKNFDGENARPENFVSVESITVNNPTGIFDKEALTFTVGVDGNNFYAAHLDLVTTVPNIVFQLDVTKIKSLQINQAEKNIATFSSQEGILSIPSVMISDSDIASNVVMALTNADIFEFTLQSLER